MAIRALRRRARSILSQLVSAAVEEDGKGGAEATYSGGQGVTVHGVGDTFERLPRAGLH